MSSKMTPDKIAQTAVQVGTVTTTAGNAVSKAAAMAAAAGHDIGIDAATMKTNRVFILTLLIDDSSSMANMVAAVLKAYAMLVEEQKKAAGTEGSCEVLLSVMFLNGGLILPYTRIAEVDGELRGYEPNNGTPLRQRGKEVLGMVMTKVAEMAEAGRTVQTYTCFISDGQPNPEDVRAVPAGDLSEVIGGMTMTKQHIVCAVDIGGTSKEEFAQWGINPKWILDPEKDPFGFEQAMAQVSRASRAASRGAGDFAKAAAGGGFR